MTQITSPGKIPFGKVLIANRFSGKCEIRAKARINPFPATIPIDNRVLSARLDLKTEGEGPGGGGGGRPPILEARV